MKKQFNKLIEWYKKNHYSQGDSYYVSMSTGCQIVFIGHTNDYPMQHGKGDSVRLTWEEVENILTQAQ